jgi:hypothetical protein
LLSTAIPEIKRKGIIVMHDMEKGLYNAQVAILPNSLESICVFHLEKNVYSKYKSKFKGKIWAVTAAKAFNESDFNKAFAEISALNPQAAT